MTALRRPASPAFVAALLAAVCAVLALAPAAGASQEQRSMMMDDDLLVYRSDAVRDRAMRQMKALGVDTVRVTVLWNSVTDKARSTKKRKRKFRMNKPGTYPIRNWDRYDRLVRAGRTLGLEVYFNVTPPAPTWARRKAPRGLRVPVRRAWMPNAKQFAKFVEALGKRYSGRYRDENDGRERLPRVSFWSLLNEPNQAGWLAPQWRKKKMVAPILARELYLRGRRALDRTGHGRDTILFGETAPLGSDQKRTTSPIYPKRFYRAMLCEKRSGRGCGIFGRLGRIRATGIAHHPYTKNVSPTRRPKSSNSITMANIKDLGVLIDTLGRRTGNIKRGLPLYMTEYGFETKPPDPRNGVSLTKQARWNQLGEYLAFRNSRIASQTQFLLRDVAPVKGAKDRRSRWFTYQSGLLFNKGKRKPAFQGYYFPFHVVSSSGGTANVWGQMRFRPDGLREQVQIQFAPRGSSTYTNVGVPINVTNVKGYFTGAVPLPGPGRLRASWVAAPAVTSLPHGVK